MSVRCSCCCSQIVLPLCILFASGAESWLVSRDVVAVCWPGAGMSVDIPAALLLLLRWCNAAIFSEACQSNWLLSVVLSSVALAGVAAAFLLRVCDRSVVLCPPENVSIDVYQCFNQSSVLCSLLCYAALFCSARCCAVLRDVVLCIILCYAVLRCAVLLLLLLLLTVA